MSEVPNEAAAQHIATIAKETGISVSSVASTAKLLAEGATVPFISRYRKEATGSLDEVQIQAVRDRMLQLAELDGRRVSIIKSLEERNLLTPDDPSTPDVDEYTLVPSARVLNFKVWWPSPDEVGTTGVAVLVLSPFEQGALFARVKGRALPAWAADIDCTSWAQFFLKFLLANPAAASRSG